MLAAVLAEQAANPYRALVAARELTAWVQRPDWPTILDNFARCVRITRSESTHYEVTPSALAEPQEKALYEAYQKAAGQLDSEGSVDSFLNALEPIIPAVTDFFDHVMVNAEDKTLRQNRLGLLQAIGRMQSGRVDLSQLNGF